MIFVICNEKGGVGKSSLAQNLAVYLKRKKSNTDLLLIDADTQKNNGRLGCRKIRRSKPTPDTMRSAHGYANLPIKIFSNKI